MKRIFILTMCLLLLSACAKSEQSGSTTEPGTLPTAAVDTQSVTDAPPPSSDEPSGIDVDLTALSSTMVYSEVYNMVTAPENYIGKTVRMQGQFAVYEGDSRNYFACLIADATACCSQGIEFVTKDSRTYPADYPELGTEITVEGVFETYQEGENTYCQLVDATMTD